MRKLPCVFVNVALAVALLSGCGDDSKDQSAADPTPSISSETVDEETPLDEACYALRRQIPTSLSLASEDWRDVLSEAEYYAANSEDPEVRDMAREFAHAVEPVVRAQETGAPRNEWERLADLLGAAYDDVDTTCDW